MSKKEDFEYFESNLENLLINHRGQFVIIKDKKFQGFFNSLEDALKNAYEKFPEDEFLIQQITDEKPVNYMNALFIPVAA
jgi:hypothetical protein